MADKAEVKKGEKYTVNDGPETWKRIDKLAGGPSFHDAAKAWESSLLADVILASASSPVHLGLVGPVEIEIASPKNKS